jgi:hypothetical protein
MIIKILSRKTKSYRQLLEYISDKEKTHWQEEAHPSFIITHNVKGKSISNWVEQFKQNEEYRRTKRTDSIYIYHEILSWNDNENLTPEKMETMTREYMQLRNPNGMYVAYPHFDGQYHVHICASGIEYKTGKSMRLPMKNLELLKKTVQQYQIEKYPELTNSIVAHGKSKGRTISDAEYQYKLRTGRETNKEQLLSLLNTCYAQADSKEDFFKRLKDHDLATYMRSGKVTGVIHKNIKHRFKKLGFNERLDALDKTRERMNDLKQAREKQQIQKTRNHGISRK